MSAMRNNRYAHRNGQAPSSSGSEGLILGIQGSCKIRLEAVQGGFSKHVQLRMSHGGDNCVRLCDQLLPFVRPHSRLEVARLFIIPCTGVVAGCDGLASSRLLPTVSFML